MQAIINTGYKIISEINLHRLVSTPTVVVNISESRLVVSVRKAWEMGSIKINFRLSKKFNKFGKNLRKRCRISSSVSEPVEAVVETKKVTIHISFPDLGRYLSSCGYNIQSLLTNPFQFFNDNWCVNVQKWHLQFLPTVRWERIWSKRKRTRSPRLRVTS